MIPTHPHGNPFRRPYLAGTLICLAISFGALFLAQIPNDTRSDWFRSLTRPEVLPRWLESRIGIIWTTIFLLAGLGTAASLAAHQTRLQKITQVALILLALFLNMAYTYTFTYRRDLELATWIAATLAVLLLVLVISVSYSRVWIALVCHSPHLAWVTFATFVTSQIARLNP